MRGVLILVLACMSTVGCSKEKHSASSDAGSDGSTKPRTVELVRDKLGIMHVYGSDDFAVFYGQGYAIATDRLFQIELQRRQAFGEQAEVLGEKWFDSDVASRALNFAALGKADLARLRKEHAELATLIEAWVLGVNARIAEIESGSETRPYGFGSDELDFVPKPWTIEHVLAVGKMFTFGMSSTLDSEILASALRKLGPAFYEAVPLSLPAYDAFTMVDYGGTKKARASAQPKARRPVRLPAGIEYKHRSFFGRSQSNNWAVAGALTDTGRPFVCGDPHQPLDSPTRFWPVHLNSKDAGGSYDVAGFAFAAAPGVQLGHNDSVAWTATTNFADVLDLFELEVGSETSLKIGKKSFKIEKRNASISIRGDNGKITKKSVTLRDVPGVGILLPDEMLPVPAPFLMEDPSSDAILMKWTGFSPSREFAAYAGMARSTNVKEWQKAADLLDVGAVNLVAADQEHIVYHVHADVPDRGDPSATPMPWLVIPIEHEPALWGNGFLDASRLPHIEDPPGGFIATANNDPWGFTADGDTSNDSFYFGNFYARGFRAHRIRTRLTELTGSSAKITRAQMQELQADTVSSMAETLVPRLVEALAAADTEAALSTFKGDPDLTAAVGALSAWDRRFVRESGEAVLFLAVEWFATRNAFADKLGSDLFDPIAEADPPYLLGMLRNTVELRYEGAEALMKGGRDAFLLAALRDATTWVKQRFGSLDTTELKLADVHVAEFDNRYGKKFDAGFTPVNGSADTVNVSAAPFFEDGVPRSMFVAEDGSLYRMVVGFASDGVPEATLNFARGASEDPSSKHFDDRQEGWANLTYDALPFRKGAVQAAEESRTMLMVP